VDEALFTAQKKRLKERKEEFTTAKASFDTEETTKTAADTNAITAIDTEMTDAATAADSETGEIK
jgi:hypothetical protein